MCGITNKNKSPEHKLLLALLERSILDYVAVKKGKYLRDTEHIDGVRVKLRCPIEYITSNEDDDFSFLWVLSHIYQTEHPEQMQSLLIKKIEDFAGITREE